jgi:hypothetical protein
MATNRLGFPNFDEICANIDGTGLNTFTNHKTGIHLLRVGQSVCVIKQFKNISDLEYEKLVWSRLSDDLKNLFVPCEFFENVLIMKPVIDFYALLTSFADIAMNITEICVWLMALLIAIYYVNMLQHSDLYFTDVKMQNFGIILNEDGTIRVVLIDIGSICIHVKSDGSRFASTPNCSQTYCPLSLFRGISHPNVSGDDTKLMSKKRMSVAIYFAFLLCIYQILTNGTSSTQQFYCGLPNINQSYKFNHGLVFSSKVFEKYKILFQEIFNFSTKYSTLDDLQNVIKRALVVLNHTNVQHMFIDMHPDFVVYFNQPSTIRDATDSIVSLIEDIFVTTVDPTASHHLTTTVAPPAQAGIISAISSVDNNAMRQMKSALSSTFVVTTFKYDTIPRFRVIDVVHTQFMSQLKHTSAHVDNATIVLGTSILDKSESLMLLSTSKAVSSTPQVGGRKHILIKPYPKHF